MGKTILVTAFEPFGGEQVNPAEIVLEMLPDIINEFRIEKLILPVEFEKAPQIAIAAYDQLKPDAVVMLGQAGGRSAINLETTARNLMDARIPDNAGFKPHNTAIYESGPEELFSTLSVESIKGALESIDIPCMVSNDAGSYVCNTLFYSLLLHNNGEVPTGFVHVPYIREQHSDKPYIELCELHSGILKTIEIISGDITRK